MPTTWNPADLALTTLSGGNLTATATSTSGYVRATHKQDAGSGKFYWEITLDVIDAAYTAMGFGPIGLSSPNSVTGTGMCLAYNSGGIVINGTYTGISLGIFSYTQVLCIALDLTTNQVWFRKAGLNWNTGGVSIGADPGTGVGGISVSSITSTDSCPIQTWGAPGNRVVANFGAGAFIGAVPSGYTAGWPAGASASAAQARAMVLA
jgi:hypothetical protein